MLQKQHVPVVLQGMDTKTDDKNTATGQLILAKNMIMQKTKKWTNRNGHTEVGSNALTNARLIAATGTTTNVVNTTSVTAIGEASSSTYTENTTIYTFDRFYQVSPYQHCEFVNAHDFATFSSDGGIINRYENGKLAYVSSGVALTPIATLAPQHHRISNDGNSNVFLVSSDAKTVYCYSQTARTSSTYAISGSPAYGKCAGAYTGGKSYVLVIYAKSGNAYGWIWNVTDNTQVTEFSIHSSYHASTFQNMAVCEWCSDGKWHVAIGADANTWNLYTVTTSGTVASASPSTQDTDALFSTGILLTYNITMSWAGVVWYSGTTTGLTDARPVSYIGTNFVDKIIVSRASRTTDNAVVLSSSGANTSSAYDSQWIYIGGYQQQGFNFGYAIAYPISNTYISSTELATFVVGRSAGALVYSTNALPTSARYNEQWYTNAGGTVSLLETSTRRIATAGYYASPVEIISVSTTGATGYLSAGEHKFFLAWVYYDAQGKAYYSPAGPEFKKTAVANDYFTLHFYESLTTAIPSERHDTTLGGGYDLTLWCTEAGGNTYYLQTSSVTYSGNGDTETLGKNRPLVTTIPWAFQGGILESGAMPPCGAVSTCAGRVWAPIALEPDRWMFSTKPSPNFGPRFPEEFRLQTSGDHGRAQIAVEMDNKIILFHEYGIFATWGDGPDETGANNFAQPILVSQSVGCKYPRSVVLTDSGVMFMSHEGIWALTKGLQMQYAYIGKDVEAYNNLTITAALNLTDRHQVWFYSLEGTTLCYDEFHKVWSVFTGEDTKAATLISGTPTFVRASDGKVLKEASATYNDAGTTFDCELKTGWISLNGVQGFARLYKFTWTGSAANTTTLTLWRDWSASNFETFTVTSGISSQWQVRPKIQKGEAMQFDLTWESITGAVEISAFSIEAGIKSGSFRIVPSTNRVKGN